MSFKTRDGKTHQSTVLIGENGLPVDTIATISGSYIFLEDTGALTYTSGSATVTLPVGSDLTPVTTAKARYTGKYILLTNDGTLYYIDRQSIDIGARTFVISLSDNSQINPASIDLSSGWKVAEADIVNRVATTSAAKIDQIEFRDMHFQMELDGDPVSLLNTEGDTINPATEEKQDTQIAELQDVNDGLDTTITQLQAVNAELDTITSKIDPTFIDDANSSTDNLGNGGVFTGAWTDVERYTDAAVTVLSDQDSAANGLNLQFSHDGITVVDYDEYTKLASQGNPIIVPLSTKYFRVVYTNGAVPTGSFSLQTKIFQNRPKPSSHRISNTITGENDAELTKSVLTAKNPNNDYINDEASGVVEAASTNTPLLASQSFTSPFIDCEQYSSISVIIKSDVMSAINGATLEYSSDGVSIDRFASVTYIPTGNGIYFSVAPQAKFFRISYTNGATDQGQFTLQIALKKSLTGPASFPLEAPITSDAVSSLVRSVATGKSTDGSYLNQRAAGVSSANSSSTPLLAGSDFTGTFEDVLGYANVGVTVISDVDSATDGLIVEYSSDGVNVDASDEFTIFASAGGSQFSFGVTTRFFRIRYINGASDQTEFRLQTLFQTSAPKPSSHRILDPISGENDAELSKAVITAENPNSLFTNTRSQGLQDINSSSTPLGADEVFRGTWFKWVNSYGKLGISVMSDVAGLLWIDFSEEESPVNGDESSVSTTLFYSYDPGIQPLFREQVPVQSKWVRVRFQNGLAAQSIFSFTSFLTINDPGLVALQLNTIPVRGQLAGVVRSVPAILNAAGTSLQELPVSSEGNPQQSVEEIHDDIAIKPLDTTLVSQTLTTTSPTRLDVSQVSDRRVVELKNLGPGRAAFGHSGSITYTSQSRPMDVGESVSVMLDSSVEVWGVAENLGGVNSLLNRSGSTAGGTATNPSDALTSNDVRATLDAVSETLTISGFTPGTSNDITSVRIGVESRKQASQTETVAFVDVVSGTAGDVGQVTSGVVTSNSEHFYLAAISRRNDSSDVTGVSGLGLTWTPIGDVIGNSGQTRLSVWRGVGVPTGNSTVTAMFSQLATNSVISVARFDNVDLASPIENSETLNDTSNTSSYSDSINGTVKGMLATFVSMRQRLHTAGSGATEQEEVRTGTTLSDASLATNTLSLASTGSHAYSGTLDGNVGWSVIALTLRPKASDNPVVNLSYELDSVPGATNQDVTVSTEIDTVQYVDITGDESWVAADISDIEVFAELISLGAASLQVDHIFIEVVDTTGNTARFSIWQGGKEVL